MTEPIKLPPWTGAFDLDWVEDEDTLTIQMNVHRWNDMVERFAGHIRELKTERDEARRVVRELVEDRIGSHDDAIDALERWG